MPDQSLAELAQFLRPESGPGRRVRYHCPLDCGWAHHLLLGDKPLRVALRGVSKDATDEEISDALTGVGMEQLRAMIEGIGAAFAAHLTDSHTAAEIQPLKDRVAR
ncbi:MULTISPECIES: hypothetical protein [unclassified Nocardia]|uniref:hypothetical protein n=1 Tax=unclassified Nocardia TaxID=2637762 RepID=UPI00278C6BF1|nr:MULTISPECIES: hypothetical protein [unclassified Nocardia]